MALGRHPERGRGAGQRNLRAVSGSGLLARLRAGRAASLNRYYFETGDPGYFPKDIGRYRKLTPEDVRAAAARWLPKGARVVLTVMPRKAAAGGPERAPVAAAQRVERRVR